MENGLCVVVDIDVFEIAAAVELDAKLVDDIWISAMIYWE